MGESIDPSLALPKLDVITINELLGVFFRDLVIRTQQRDGPYELAIHADDVGSILWHLAAFGSTMEPWL